MSDTERISSTPAWRPLTREQRRVIGVLIEKAKTTPEAYPMTLNGITTGCNQKNNRAPQMELETTEVETVLDELRQMGAVTEVQGSGRVDKFRHNMYQWLGVDKVELAVMAELLLRGQQTVGELRGRAARMESIADMNELKPVLEQLISKRLLLELTPPGRGQIVTHNLYQERELQKVRELVAADGAAELADDGDSPVPRSPSGSASSASDVKAQLQSLQELLDRVVRRIEQLEAKIG